jgi:hypothetical protein
VWANNIPVSPGTTYSVGVGWGGSGTGAAGGNSWFVSTSTMIAFGGTGGSRGSGSGGSWTSTSSLTSVGGSMGGQGGWQSWGASTGDTAGGGGGAGGYTGKCSHISRMLVQAVGLLLLFHTISVPYMLFKVSACAHFVELCATRCYAQLQWVLVCCELHSSTTRQVCDMNCVHRAPNSPPYR